MEAIDKALADSEIPNAFWPVPLIDALEAKDINRIVPWVAQCLFEWVTKQNYWASESLAAEIPQLVEAKSVQTVTELAKRYDDLMACDKIIASYIHLILAKQSLLEGNIDKLRTRAMWSLMCLCDYDSESKKRGVRLVIDIYKVFMGSIERTQLVSSPLEEPE